MKQKYKRVVLNRYIGGALLCLLIASATAVAVTPHNHLDAAPSASPEGAEVASQFSFSGTPGWWQGATNKTSLAVFPNAHDCFVSVQYKTGAIAPDEASLQKDQAKLVGSGYVITVGAPKAATIQTTAGLKSYQLQQYSVTTPAGANKVEGGEEFGYIQLASNHIFVEGYCDTTAELPTTLPVLQAISFKSTS